MAGKAAFTAQEWEQVLGSAFMAGFAITAADPSGLWGLFKETFASSRALLDAKNNPAANELSKAIVADLQTPEGRGAAQAFVKTRLQDAKRDDIKQRAIDVLRSAADVALFSPPSFPILGDAIAYTVAPLIGEVAGPPAD